MKTFSTFFGKLPLAGKYFVRMQLASILTSKNPHERGKAIMAYVLMLTFWLIGHSMQAYLGYKIVVMSHQVLFRYFGILYCAVNLLADLEHTYILVRIIRIALRRRGKYCTIDHAKTIKSESAVQEFFSDAFTLGGQICFAIIYILSC